MRRDRKEIAKRVADTVVSGANDVVTCEDRKSQAAAVNERWGFHYGSDVVYNYGNRRGGHAEVGAGTRMVRTSKGGVLISIARRGRTQAPCKPLPS